MMEMIIEMDTRGCAFETYWVQLKPHYKIHVDQFFWDKLGKFPAQALASNGDLPVSSSEIEAPEMEKKAGQEVEKKSIPNVTVPQISDGFTAFLEKHQLSGTQQFLLKVFFFFCSQAGVCLLENEHHFHFFFVKSFFFFFSLAKLSGSFTAFTVFITYSFRFSSSVGVRSIKKIPEKSTRASNIFARHISVCFLFFGIFCAHGFFFASRDLLYFFSRHAAYFFFRKRAIEGLAVKVQCFSSN